MKLKWTVITLIALAATAAGIYWGVDAFNENKSYQGNMRNARNAVAAHNWSDAALYYSAARGIRVSVENRTALEQLNYLKRADKEIRHNNWQSALNLYSLVLATNGGVDLLNKAAKSGEDYVTALKNADESADKASSLQVALDKKSSELTKARSSAEAAVKTANDAAKAAQDSAKSAVDAANDNATDLSKALSSQQAADKAAAKSEAADTKTSKVDNHKKDKAN